MTARLTPTTYTTAASGELVMIGGEADDVIRVMVIPPLFDELNRMRRTLAMAMRALAARGIAVALPDLPGLNESMTPIANVRWTDWTAALRSAATQFGATHVAGLRAGCALDHALPHLPRWRYAPLSADRALTQLVRIQMASDKADGVTRSREDYATTDHVPDLAGYAVSTDMRAAMQNAAEMDAADSIFVETAKLGPLLWLRAEPGESAEFADAMAGSLLQWARTA